MKKIFFLLCILAAGCTSTSIINSWKSPDAKFTPEEFKKVMVVAFVKDEAQRKLAEDEMVSLNKSFYASYLKYTNKQIMEDSVRIKAQLKTEGFDAVVVMRLITTVAKNKFVQGGMNPAYTQNYLFYYQDYLKAGSYATDMNYIIATNFYSLKQDKLLWTGVTESTNPKRIDKLVREVSKEVVLKMREDKFIPEK